MMKKIEDMTEGEKEHLVEIEMRGRFMTMAADLEWSMLMIMTHCVPNPAIQRNFAEMTMHNKIECMIADLKKHKRPIYDKYEQEILKLWQFKDFRNKIAHRKIDFETVHSFRFLYVDLDKGQERIFEEKFTTTEVYNGIKEFIKLNFTLVQLFAEMTGMANIPASNP